MKKYYLKEDVKLTELYKYGFEQSIYEPLLVKEVQDNNYNLKCFIDKNDKHIWISEKGRPFCNGEFDYEYIQDLIKANLVEERDE